jgi:hypothetical protein
MKLRVDSALPGRSGPYRAPILVGLLVRHLHLKFYGVYLAYDSYENGFLKLHVQL